MEQTPSLPKQIRPPAAATAMDVFLIMAIVGALWGKQIYFALSSQQIWVQESMSVWALRHWTMFTSTLAISVALAAYTLLFRSPLRLALLVGTNLLVTTLILSDHISVTVYGDVLSVQNLEAAHLLDDIAPSVLNHIAFTDLFYFADIGAIMLAFFVLRNLWPAGAQIFVVPPKRLFLCLVVLSVLLTLPGLRLALLDANGLPKFAYLQREVAASLGIIPFHILDLAAINRPQDERGLDEDEIRKTLAYVAARGEQSKSPLAAAAEQTNLILINAESLQAFPVDLSLQGQPLTPNLSKLAAESLRFTAFYDQTHLGTTSDAEFLALQSLHPLPVGYVAYQFQSNHYYGLPAILRQRGYATVAACAASPDFWNMEHLHRQYGFQQSWYEPDYRVTDRVGPWLADGEFFAQTVEKIARLPEPFFLFMLTGSNHDPYDLPHKDRTLELGDLEGTTVGKYLQSVHYFDSALGMLVNELRERGILDRSMLVLYGDHQGFLGDAPELQRLLKIDPEDELQNFMTRKKLPFLIRLPLGSGASDFPTRGGHLDIAPTILSLLGINEANGMLGRDLTAGGPSLVVFRDGSFIDDTIVFLNRFGPLSSSAAYEVASGRQISTAGLAPRRAAAFDQLETSDSILRGDLVLTLRQQNFKDE